MYQYHVKRQIFKLMCTNPDREGSGSVALPSLDHYSQTHCFVVGGWYRHGFEHVCPDHKSQSSQTTLTRGSNHHPLERAHTFSYLAFIFSVFAENLNVQHVKQDHCYSTTCAYCFCCLVKINPVTYPCSQHLDSKLLLGCMCWDTKQFRECKNYQQKSLMWYCEHQLFWFSVIVFIWLTTVCTLPAARCLPHRVPGRPGDRVVGTVLGCSFYAELPQSDNLSLQSLGSGI